MPLPHKYLLSICMLVLCKCAYIYILYIAFVSRLQFLRIIRKFFQIMLSRVPKIANVTGNRKSFSGNERKYFKLQSFFIAKQKQCTVSITYRIAGYFRIKNFLTSVNFGGFIFEISMF